MVKTQKTISFTVYLIAAMTLGLAAYYSMMAGVWGVPINPLNYLAVIAAIALFFGSFVCFFKLSTGRMICGIALTALGLFYIPAIVSIIPVYKESISPVGYLIFLDYFGALTFVLFYPTRLKFAFSILLTVLVISGAFAGITFAHRFAGGEFDRPSFAFFVWKPGGTALQIKNDGQSGITAEAKSLLDQKGIHGRLEWVGSTGYGTEKNRVIILAQCQITAPKKIFYPRNGTIIYAFDGTNWITFPQSMPTYATSATLDTEGFNTIMHEKLASGGIQGAGAFYWK